MIKKRNLDTSLVNWMIQQGMGAMGFAGTGPSGYEGEIYYVNMLGGSDDYDGLSPETPFATYAKAVTATAVGSWSTSPWADHNIIIVYPGVYAENITSMPHGNITIGLFGDFDLKDNQLGASIKPSSGSAVDAASIVNAAFFNMNFEGLTTYAAFDAEIINNVLFQNCRFTGPVETSTAAAGIVTKDSVRMRCIESEFVCLDKGIDVNYADAGDSFSHALIKDCNFSQIDTAGIEISTNLVGPSSLVTRCNFHGGGVTMATAIDDNSAILDVTWCAAESTNGFDGCRSVNASYNNGALVT